MAGNKNVTGVTIKLRNVRLSFPSLKEPTRPKKFPDSPLSWAAKFLLDPTNESHKQSIRECNAEIKRLRLEVWGSAEGHPKEDKRNFPFGKGETQTNDEGIIYNGYEGMYFFSGKSPEKNRPLILNRDKSIISDPKEVDRILYGGCYVNANINFWVQNGDVKAIRGGLQAVQFWADGDAFGGGRASVDDFDDVEEPEGMDELDGFDDDDLGL